jgi:hypothetical protein
MPLGILFWVIYIISLVFNMWASQVPGQPFTYRQWGGSLLFYVLVGILGWKVFGAAVSG